MIIDFFAILPTIALALVGWDCRFLRIFRLVRIFKLARYSPAIRFCAVCGKACPGGFVTLLGIAMYGLPIAIITSGFTNEFYRRDFVITWGMVARIPLFAKLSPETMELVTRSLACATGAGGL